MASVDKLTLASGASCSIAPGWGCNMFSWIVDGEELIWCPPDLPDTAKKITGGGNPILFPSVGRTWDTSVDPPVQGRYTIYGSDRTYFMPSHGIVFLCSWERLGQTLGSDSVEAAYELVVPAKVREENYPFDLGLTQKFVLRPTSVDLEAVITNRGDRIAPAAFGYHPYFRISGASREGVEVRLPVKKRLLTTPHTILLSGETEDTDGVWKLQPDIYYDHGFGEPTGTRMSLIDGKPRRTIHVDFDRKCELFFLYTPNGTEFVCIEPWSRGLGAYELLKDPGWDSGEAIPVLQPGERVTYRATFSVER